MQPCQSVVIIDDEKDDYNYGSPDGRGLSKQACLKNLSRPRTICSFWKFGNCRDRRNPATIMHPKVTARSRNRGVSWTGNSFIYKAETEDGCARTIECNPLGEGKRLTANANDLNTVAVSETGRTCQTVTSSLTSHGVLAHGAETSGLGCHWQQQDAPDKSRVFQLSPARIKNDVYRNSSDPRLHVKDYGKQRNSASHSEHYRKCSRYADTTDFEEDRRVWSSGSSLHQRISFSRRPKRFHSRRSSDRYCERLDDVVEPEISSSSLARNCTTDEQQENALQSPVHTCTPKEGSDNKVQRIPALIISKNKNNDHAYSVVNEIEPFKKRGRKLTNRKRDESDLVRCRVAGANGVEVWLECNLGLLGAGKLFRSSDERRKSDELASSCRTTTVTSESQRREKNDYHSYVTDEETADVMSHDTANKTREKVDFFVLVEKNDYKDVGSRDQKDSDQLRAEAQDATEAVETVIRQQTRQRQQNQRKETRENPGIKHRIDNTNEVQTSLQNYPRDREYSTLQIKPCAVKLEKLAIERYLQRASRNEYQLSHHLDIVKDDPNGDAASEAASTAVKLERANSEILNTSTVVGESCNHVKDEAANLDDVIENVSPNKTDETSFFAGSVTTEIDSSDNVSDLSSIDDHANEIARSTRGIVSCSTKPLTTLHPAYKIGSKSHQRCALLPRVKQARVGLRVSVTRNRTTKKQKVRTNNSRQQKKTKRPHCISAQKNKKIRHDIMSSKFHKTSNEGKNLSTKSSASSLEPNVDKLTRITRQRKGTNTFIDEDSATDWSLSRKKRQNGDETKLLTPKIKLKTKKIKKPIKLTTSNTSVHSKVGASGPNVRTLVTKWPNALSQSRLELNPVKSTIEQAALGAKLSGHSSFFDAGGDGSSLQSYCSPLMELTKDHVPHVNSIGANKRLKSILNDRDSLQSSSTNFNRSRVKPKPCELAYGSCISAQCTSSRFSHAADRFGRNSDSKMSDLRSETALSSQLEPFIANQKPQSCFTPTTADTTKVNETQCLVPIALREAYSSDLFYRMAQLMSTIVYLSRHYKLFPSLIDRKGRFANCRVAAYFEKARCIDGRKSFAEACDQNKVLYDSNQTAEDDTLDARTLTVLESASNRGMHQDFANGGGVWASATDSDVGGNDQLQSRTSEAFDDVNTTQEAAEKFESYSTNLVKARNYRSKIAQHYDDDENDDEEEEDEKVVDDWRCELDVEPEASQLAAKQRGVSIKKLCKRSHPVESNTGQTESCAKKGAATKRKYTQREAIIGQDCDQYLLSKKTQKVRRRKRLCVMLAEKATDSSDLNGTDWATIQHPQNKGAVKLRLVRRIKKREYGVQTDSCDNRELTIAELVKEKRTKTSVTNMTESIPVFDDCPMSNGAPYRLFRDVASPAISQQDMLHYDEPCTVRPFWFPSYSLYSSPERPYQQPYRQWNQQRYGTDCGYYQQSTGSTWSNGSSFGCSSDGYNSRTNGSSYNGGTRTMFHQLTGTGSDTHCPSRQCGYTVTCTSSNQSYSSTSSGVPASLNNHVKSSQPPTYNSLKSAFSLVEIGKTSEFGTNNDDEASPSSSNDAQCDDILAAAVAAAGVSLASNPTPEDRECGTTPGKDVVNATTISTSPSCDDQSIPRLSAIEVTDMITSGASDNLDKENFRNSEKSHEHNRIADDSDVEPSKSPMAPSLLSFTADGLSPFDYEFDLSAIVDEPTMTTTSVESANETERTVDVIGQSQPGVKGQETTSDVDLPAGSSHLTDRSTDVVVVDGNADGTGRSVTLWNLDGRTSTEFRRTLLLGDDFHDLLLDQMTSPAVTSPAASSPPSFATVELPARAPSSSVLPAAAAAAECCSRAPALNYSRNDAQERKSTMTVANACCAGTSCSVQADALIQPSAFRKYTRSRGGRSRRNTVGYDRTASYFRTPWCYPFLPQPGPLWPGYVFPLSTWSPYSSSYWDSRSLQYASQSELQRRSWLSRYGGNNYSECGSGLQYYSR